MHIIQHYEVLQNFSEEYLSIPGNLGVVLPLSAFNKDYARAGGWVFQNDEYADSTYAKLGDDAQSQKTTEYGRTKYIEDVAESGAGFLLCKTTEFSESRIAWWEKMIGAVRSSYCPSKI